MRLPAGPQIAIVLLVASLDQAGPPAVRRPAPPAADRSETRAAETLRSSGGLPVEVVGVFEDPVTFQQARAGQYFVLDRRGQAVFGIDAARTSAWKIVGIGQERGRIYRPQAFAVEPGGNFVVVDLPTNEERLQIFAAGGAPLVGGFTLPARRGALIAMGPVLSNLTTSLQFSGTSILLNVPENGALVTEHTLAGATTRTFGTLRQTGHEAEPDLHLALNAGLPLLNPRGGYYFVFLAGTPLFRKYDATGKLLFERHIEGRELDESIMALPEKWVKRSGTSGDRVPVVAALVRAAAVDPAGNLWVSFVQPYTYVYNPDGEKIRVVQFYGAGIIRPSGLFFAGPGQVLVAPGCYIFDVPR